MSDSESILGGVFVHVLGGLALIIVLYMFRRIILVGLEKIPGLQARPVRGTWHTTFHKGTETFREKAVVHQFGPWVWGTIEYPDKKKKYEFSGTLCANVRETGRPIEFNVEGGGVTFHDPLSQTNAG